MPHASSYARALFEATHAHAADASALLNNLKAALKRRGHEKLLPRIFSEYEKLELGERRRQAQTRITPEAERTRILMELYRKLINTA